MKKKSQEPGRRIIARASREQFVGRTNVLEQLTAHVNARIVDGPAPKGLLILAEPLSGASELLRQAFDHLFAGETEVFPVYFALPQAATTSVSAAIEYLNTFLLHYVAYKRRQPELCRASMTLSEIAGISPASDAGWIENLIDAFRAQRFGEDDAALIRFCLNAPLRNVPKDVRPSILFNATQLSNYDEQFQGDIVRALMTSGQQFAVAGLRRDLLTVFQRSSCDMHSMQVINLDRFDSGEAQRFISSDGRARKVSITNETRDLLAQQLEGKPFFMRAVLQAARNSHLPLDSYLACQRVYVDE